MTQPSFLPNWISRNYHFEPELRCYLKSDFKDEFTYTDGAEVEERILTTLQAVRDRSALSMELESHCSDWVSTYHFSSYRSNLLRPLKNLIQGKTVLELGAGCGGVTRYLAESGKGVVAVEGSVKRAQICAERTLGLENISVLVDRLDALLPDEQFDVVTLIGVLEYSRAFIAGDVENPDPIQWLLNKARSWLKPDGVLIVAIENQLGLKYLAGAPEDHLNQPWAGVNDLYAKSGGVVTFGAKELENRLLAAQFAHTECLIPVPDYKLPVSVLYPEGVSLSSLKFDAGTFFSRSTSAHWQGEAPPAFSLELAWGVVSRNQLLRELANSFLFLASPAKHSTPLHGEESGILAKHYGSLRIPEYSKETVFSYKYDKIQIERRPFIPTRRHSAKIKFHLPAELYEMGTVWSIELVKVLNQRNWSSA